MTKLWFQARRYGWGWTPVTVEGWLVMSLFLAAVIVSTGVFLYRVRSAGDLLAATITFLLSLAILVAALVVICWMTGERPRWRWGD
ncbi:MAG: hypothetical protein ACLQJR_22265 [Stellaceae bacterium]